MNDLPCRRCLLHELGKDEFFRGIYEYIAGLGDDVRAPDSLYKERLEICRSCDNLIDGMCKLCGCFVEVRAVKKLSYCAMDKSIW